MIPDPAPPIAAIAIRPEHVVRVFFNDGEVRDEIGLDPDVIYAALDPSQHAPRIRALVAAN